MLLYSALVFCLPDAKGARRPKQNDRLRQTNTRNVHTQKPSLLLKTNRTDTAQGSLLLSTPTTGSARHANPKEPGRPADDAHHRCRLSFLYPGLSLASPQHSSRFATEAEPVSANNKNYGGIPAIIHVLRGQFEHTPARSRWLHKARHYITPPPTCSARAPYHSISALLSTRSPPLAKKGPN